MYCVSVTAKVKEGGTKKKSKARTPRERGRRRRMAPEAVGRPHDPQKINHRQIHAVEVMRQRPVDERAQRDHPGRPADVLPGKSSLSLQDRREEKWVPSPLMM